MCLCVYIYIYIYIYTCALGVYDVIHAEDDTSFSVVFRIQTGRPSTITTDNTCFMETGVLCPLYVIDLDRERPIPLLDLINYSRDSTALEQS